MDAKLKEVLRLMARYQLEQQRALSSVLLSHECALEILETHDAALHGKYERLRDARLRDRVTHRVRDERVIEIERLIQEVDSL